MKPLKSGTAKTYSRPLASKSGGAFALPALQLVPPVPGARLPDTADHQNMTGHCKTYRVKGATPDHPLTLNPALNELAPEYLITDCCWAGSRRSGTRSAGRQMLEVVRMNTSFGDRSFAAAASRVWNGLPQRRI